MTGREVFNSLVQDFIEKDGVEMAYPLVGNDPLAAIVHAWAFLNVQVDTPEMIVDYPTDERERWGFLWSHARWDNVALSLAAGQNEDSVLVLLHRAKELRMIYPDGRISSSVRQFLGLRVIEEMSKGASQISGRNQEDRDDHEFDKFN